MRLLLRFFERLAVLVLVFFAFTPDLHAQAWGGGVYQTGMGQMMWGGQLPQVTASGNAILDSVASPGIPDTSKSRYMYFIDSAGNGLRRYQLFFGPYWYNPLSGALRPQNGQPIVVRGGLYTGSIPPVLAVYSINGQVWRDSTGAPPWSGSWVRRSSTDSARVRCAGDSTSWLSFPPGVMGTGMMGGGMMSWPDSMFVDFEQMIPDSLPFMTRATAFAGFHLNLFNPTGTFMIPGSPMSGFGVVNMMRPIQIRVHTSPDTLLHHGLKLSEMRLMFLDVDSTWQEVLNQKRDSVSSIITATPPNLHEYYALTAGATTGIASDGTRPTIFALLQNYPNPFNPTTGIRYQVPGVSDVNIAVYDLLGRRVAVLVNERKPAGRYEVTFDGTGLASGVYMYQYTASPISGGATFQSTKKMLLVK